MLSELESIQKIHAEFSSVANNRCIIYRYKTGCKCPCYSKVTRINNARQYFSPISLREQIKDAALRTLPEEGWDKRLTGNDWEEIAQKLAMNIFFLRHAEAYIILGGYDE
jgi:hypothetical protein